jgi:hypothetical protein
VKHIGDLYQDLNRIINAFHIFIYLYGLGMEQSQICFFLLAYMHRFDNDLLGLAECTA